MWIYWLIFFIVGKFFILVFYVDDFSGKIIEVKFIIKF